MNPETREELYLAALAGENIDLPEPLTREEMYLTQIVDRLNNSGGSSAGYDIVARYTGRYVLVSGSYADIAAKLAAGEPISGIYVNGDGFESLTYYLNFAYWEEGTAGEPIKLEFHNLFVNPYEWDSLKWKMLTLSLASDGTLSYVNDFSETLTSINP